jgi:2-dehydro-3-deoxyglucarate aldolase
VVKRWWPPVFFSTIVQTGGRLHFHSAEKLSERTYWVNCRQNCEKFVALKDLSIGSWINTSSPVAAEIMSAAGFDFLVVDAEHAAVGVSQAQCLFQAIKAGNPHCVPMVRLPQDSYIEARRYLDAGAMGVIAALINSKTEAEKLVRAVKYPPQGERGVGYGRSHGYGFAFEEYMKTANAKTLVGVQIEHIRGYENLDEILSVAGIDFVCLCGTAFLRNAASTMSLPAFTSCSQNRKRPLQE